MSVESVTQVKAKATKTTALVDCRVKEFIEFIRDHRPQDDIRLEVERITEEQCSACRRAWEVDYSESVPVCANCGAEVSL